MIGTTVSVLMSWVMIHSDPFPCLIFCLDSPNQFYPEYEIGHLSAQPSVRVFVRPTHTNLTKNLRMMIHLITAVRLICDHLFEGSQHTEKIMIRLIACNTEWDGTNRFLEAICEYNINLEAWDCATNAWWTATAVKIFFILWDKKKKLNNFSLKLATSNLETSAWT